MSELITVSSINSFANIFPISFSIPWERNTFFENSSSVSISYEDGFHSISTYPLAYWEDGSVKWTSHSISALNSTEIIIAKDELTGSYINGSYVNGTVTSNGTIVTNANGTWTNTTYINGTTTSSSSLNGTSISNSSSSSFVNATYFNGAYNNGTFINGTFDESSVFEIEEDDELLEISNAAGLYVVFDKTSSNVIRLVELDDDEIVVNGTIVGSSSLKADDYTIRDFENTLTGVSIEKKTLDKLVVLIEGNLTSSFNQSSNIPYKIRANIHSESDVIKFTNTIIYDLSSNENIRSLGLKLTKSFGDETPVYDRHIRISGENGAVLTESAQSVTGLWHAANTTVREKQIEGIELPDIDDPEWGWDANNLSYVTTFDQYSLAQLTSNGFQINKRSKTGYSRLKIGGGGRSDGSLFIGAPQVGGVSVGVVKFWEKYPSELSVDGFTHDNATNINIWFYSPQAQPLEVTSYHDGLGQDDFVEQRVALRITYEDYEPGLDTPTGVARSFEVYLKPSPSGDRIASKQEFTNFAQSVREPPIYIADLKQIYKSEVFPYWKPRSTDGESYVNTTAPSNSSLTGNRWLSKRAENSTLWYNSTTNETYSTNATLVDTTPHTITSREEEIEQHLDFLFNYYVNQIDLHDWYGFWDYGDVQHTYDDYRHQWRYDVGGFAWDNSELSTDTWLWLYYLHSGNATAFRIAESLTKHTSEVDIYHLGKYKGFGTRHGVQHWSDSSKQLRVSNAFYKKFYYYLSGGDERLGEILNELTDSEEALLSLDAHRKTQDLPQETPEGLAVSTTLDWGSLIGVWLYQWERRQDGWEHGRDKLYNSIRTIAELPYGLITNEFYLNITSGEVSEIPNLDPEWAISHLNAVFGLSEAIVELIDTIKYANPDLEPDLVEFWTDYAISYLNGAGEQEERYGVTFPKGKLNLKQSHARLTAYAAWYFDNSTLAKASWKQFFHTDGYSDELVDWQLTPLPRNASLSGADHDAGWISTNLSAQYGISAIYLLQFVGKYLTNSS